MVRAVMFVATGLATALLVWFVSGPPDRLWLYWPGVALAVVAAAMLLFAHPVAAWWRRHRGTVR